MDEAIYKDHTCYQRQRQKGENNKNWSNKKGKKYSINNKGVCSAAPNNSSKGKPGKITNKLHQKT